MSQQKSLSQQKTHVMKINLLGDGAVGKSCLRKNYLGEAFESSYQETIGADFSLKYEDIQLENEPKKRHFKFQIWDVAGQPRYTQVGQILYDKSEGALLVFDLANRTSFLNCHNWMRTYLQYAGIGIIWLVGNKDDLRSNVDVELISTEEGKLLAQQLSEEFHHPVQYIETSAKTGHNVRQAFVSVAKTFLELKA